MNETPLCKLAFKYRSDKCERLGRHTYTEYYYDLLKARRKTIKKVLEIGIGKGASLKMWRDFFPNAKIYGVDYRPDFLIKEDRIESILCDQRRREHLVSLIEKTGSDIDLVVEDASHRSRDQVFTCLTLMPLLKKEAIYIIEDVSQPNIVERIGQYQYDVEIPKIPYRNRFDNRLVVVRHKTQTDISFFAKMPQRTGQDRHLTRVSSIIRAQQIADYIGAKLNPIEGYQNGVCIYVKPPYKSGSDLKFYGKPYLDIVDSIELCELARKHPEVTVISLSDWSHKILKKLLPNKIINIPQQHCNFERAHRNTTQIKKVGIIGVLKAFEYLPESLRRRLKRRGTELVEFSKFSTRQDIVNFYMGIDVQIVWRPYYNYKKDLLANPLKIVNASSFGIPTIAYAEKAFEEMKGCYIPVRTLEEFLTELDKLRSRPALYNKYAKRCLEKAEAYHIEKIAQMYKNLT